MADKATKKVKITEIVPDDKNLNMGSQYGKHILDKSFEKFGAGRSILLDKNNRVIAGNKSLETFGENGGEDVIIIETTGKQIVAVKRTDIDLDTPLGREMGLADNVSAIKNIRIDEIKAVEILGEAKVLEWGVEFQEEEDEEEMAKSTTGLYPLAIVLNRQQYAEWNELKKKNKARGDTECFVEHFNL